MAGRDLTKVAVTGKNLQQAVTGLLAKIKQVEDALNEFISDDFAGSQASNSSEILRVESAVGSQAGFGGWVFYRWLPRTVAQGAELSICIELGTGRRVWSDRLKSFIYFDSTQLVTDDMMTDAVVEHGGVAILVSEDGNATPYEWAGGTIVEQDETGVSDTTTWPLKKTMEKTAEALAAKAVTEMMCHVDAVVRESYLTDEGKAALMSRFGNNSSFLMMTDKSKLYTIAEKAREDGSGIERGLTVMAVSPVRIYYTDSKTEFYPSVTSFLWRSGMYIYDSENASFRNLGTHEGLVDGIYE